MDSFILNGFSSEPEAVRQCSPFRINWFSFDREFHSEKNPTTTKVYGNFTDTGNLNGDAFLVPIAMYLMDFQNSAASMDSHA